MSTKQKLHRAWVVAALPLPALTPSQAWQRLLHATAETRDVERVNFIAVLEGWEKVHRRL